MDEAEWCTCPVTENGFVRIYSQPSYLGGPKNTERAGIALRLLQRATPRHRFIPDDISLVDEARIRLSENVAPAMLTNLYLLALAVKHGAKFVTLDLQVRAELMAGGAEALEQLV